MWNRLEPTRRLPVDNIWLDSLRHEYRSRSKRIRLPMMNSAPQM